MIALEEYTSAHADAAEEIMYSWPWRRFEGMFRLHLLRKARDELRQMRDMRLAAMDANMNYDAKENAQARQSRVDGLQRSYEEAVRVLYSLDPIDDAGVVDQDDDPLFAPLARRRAAQAGQPLVKEAGMGRQLLEVTS